ncbi:MAG: butyrate kinase [Elusimicrobiales bacterium]
MDYRVLVINPGSTSDDIGVFLGEEQILSKTLRYSPSDLSAFDGKKVTAQFEFRKRAALEVLESSGPGELHAVIGRGGLVRPIPGGTYLVDGALLADLREGVMGDHPSNLGGIIASEIAGPRGIPAFIADPVVVDEMWPLARYSGMPENPRVSIFHALNQKRVARLAAAKLGKKYEECSLVVLHGGGGISVGAHKNGRVVDVNNALDGDGPFTPQRSGGVPAGGLAKMCFSGKYRHDEIKLKIKGRGGLVAHAGTSDMVALEKYINTGELIPGAGMDTTKLSREKARECVEAMAYQMAKEIGAMAAALGGKVDAVVITGGLAYDARVTGFIEERAGWIAPVLKFPGGDEKRALRDAAVSALENPNSVKRYQHAYDANR